ncbi:unnamed protein product [Strongylus vulgaris]|uniref:Peptidase C1A papain C-terminal domain-containing protein n=1 Tax=Strongylus vulgaris TaxID=40348 RepID=A0A3P7LJK4_STRVU|nr:unnamed protein product [Strongylus vulgaris]
MNMEYFTKVGNVDGAEEIGFDGEIPPSFDAREEWRECDSIKYIRDQSNCGASWAISAASAMSDRLCIQTMGQIKVGVK